MSRWFEIRNAPKPNGIVIAIWHCDTEGLELAYGAKNLKYSSDNEDDIRTYARHGFEAEAIDKTLVREVSEAEFSVLQKLADIPQIISDGVLHYLGVLTWSYDSFGSHTGDETLLCTGDVYAKVIANEKIQGTIVDTSLQNVTVVAQ